MSNNLKAYRAKYDMTQSQLAEKLNISTTSYSMKENKKTEFTLKEAKAIADLFGTTIDKVFFNKSY